MQTLVLILVAVTLIVGVCGQATGCYRSHKAASSQKTTQLPPPVASKEESAGNGLLQKRNQELEKTLSFMDPSFVSAAVPQASPSQKRRNLPSARLPLYADHAQVEGEGEVVFFVSHDPGAVNLQKFLVRLDSGKTMLIVHDTTRSKRIADLKLGDQVAFCGEYFYGQNGDEIRVDEPAPDGQPGNGWVKHKGQTYR